MNYCVCTHEVVQCHSRNNFCCSWWVAILVVSSVFGNTYNTWGLCDLQNKFPYQGYYKNILIFITVPLFVLTEERAGKEIDTDSNPCMWQQNHLAGWCRGNDADLYSKGVQVESSQEHWVSRLKFFVVFPNLSMPCWDSTSVRLRSFPFINHAVIRRYIIWTTDGAV
jgi:hypothetical protein